MRAIMRQALYALGYGVLGSILVLVGGYIYMLEARPDLKVWHQADLDAEFTADHAAEIRNLDDYRRLEDRLFAQLGTRVYDKTKPADHNQVNRYSAGSRMDPQGFPHNWNRTFELVPEHPVGGVLMLHGLSDSPYSFRSLGQMLHHDGYRVVGLRLPGHGTAPSGLLKVTWQDWAQAVRIAARDLREHIGPDRPLYIFGYSNGAALAVEYALSVLEGEALPRPEGIVLLSPAIGVTPVAALAIWQSRMGRLAGLEKLAWNSIQAEFDPYKYNSFTVNAGDQIYRLTGSISSRIGQLHNGAGGIEGFPRVLAFLSVVDATVPPESVINTLLSRLAAEGHELVLFDVNRHLESQALLKSALAKRVSEALELPNPAFGLTLLTNVDPGTDDVFVLSRKAGASEVVKTPLDMRWPRALFSLSHVALPFPPDDPVYGATPDEDPTHPWITLGSVDIKGERGLLLFPDDYFLRLRYNPFHAYLREKVTGFMRFGETAPR